MTIYDELVYEAYAKFKLLFGYYKQDRESITMYFLLLDNMKWPHICSNVDLPVY